MSLGQLDLRQSEGLAEMRRRFAAAGLTRREWGARLDISGEHFGRILDGKNPAGGALMKRIGEEMGFDPGLFFRPSDGDVFAIVVPVEQRGGRPPRPTSVSDDRQEGTPSQPGRSRLRAAAEEARQRVRSRRPSTTSTSGSRGSSRPSTHSTPPTTKPPHGSSRPH